MRLTNCGRGDVGHSCLGEDCEISGRAQVNGRRSGGVNAVRDGLQIKTIVRDGNNNGGRKELTKRPRVMMAMVDDMVVGG